MANRGRQYSLLADEDLISLVEESDSQAFAVLHDRHSRTAYSLAYRMMGEKQAAIWDAGAWQQQGNSSSNTRRYLTIPDEQKSAYLWGVTVYLWASAYD